MNMKKLSSILLAVAFALLLIGCGKEPAPEPQRPKPPTGYLELLKAYDAGKVFISAEHQPACCVISFSDGQKITVSDSAMKIHDCTESTPETVLAAGSWWKVGDVTKAIKVEISLTKEEALPVYVYFDSKTLHMHISNGQHLVFQSEKQQEEDELAKRQNIPVVRIKTDGNAPILDKKNYVKGSITISDPEGLYSDVEIFEASMGIRGRGNSTWGWPKKPWKVKLDEKAEILGMPADKEWALLANYSDRTLIRNLTAMKISEICGFSWTPRMRSVEVYLNNEYQGVYTFCEHKKVSSDRVDVDIAGETDNSGDAVTGGYYFEIEEQMDETTCWYTGMGVPMMFSDPEEPTEAQLEYVKKYFADFEACLRSADLASPTKGYAAYIDVDSFINYYILQELTKNIDGNLRKSSFITKERGQKLEMYHVWDFDLTLGNCGYFDWRVGNGPEGFWIKDFASNCTPGDNWFNLMMKDPAFVLKLRERWNALMPELRNVAGFIDDQALVLDPAQKRNFNRWNINESVDWVMFPSLGSYEKEVGYLKEFYTERLEWLDVEINKL